MNEYGEDGVDVSLIRWMLSLTPAERLAVLESSIQFVNEARAANEPQPVSPDPADSHGDRG